MTPTSAHDGTPPSWREDAKVMAAYRALQEGVADAVGGEVIDNGDTGLLDDLCDAVASSVARREGPRKADVRVKDTLIEDAMGLICNVDGGDLTKQRPEWTDAARRWITGAGNVWAYRKDESGAVEARSPSPDAPDREPPTGAAIVSESTRSPADGARRVTLSDGTKVTHDGTSFRRAEANGDWRCSETFMLRNYCMSFADVDLLRSLVDPPLPTRGTEVTRGELGACLATHCICNNTLELADELLTHYVIAPRAPEQEGSR